MNQTIFQTILVIHYHSGITTYIPKDERALDIIISNFHKIEEVVEVNIDAAAATVNPNTGETK